MKRSEGLKPPMPPHSSAKFVGRAQARDSMKVVTRQWTVVGKSVFCFALCALLFAFCLPIQAQQLAKVPRIGYLAPSVSANRFPFEQALRELGYVEGKNIVIEWRANEGNLDRNPPLAAELVRLKVDVIVAAGSQTDCRTGHQTAAALDG